VLLVGFSVFAYGGGKLFGDEVRTIRSLKMTSPEDADKTACTSFHGDGLFARNFDFENAGQQRFGFFH
jgi:hypothetical protein